MHKLTVVILTYNEEIHIARAINNVLYWADKIIVLDSHSQDNTVEIATNLGAEVIFRKFDDYKKQRQFAIEYCKNITEWMLFLDADEYLLDDTKIAIKSAIEENNDIVGYYMSFRFIFMGRWIKHGGYYPCYLLRLFKPKTAIIDEEINEHVTVNGRVEKLMHDFVDHRLKNIASWIDKHNKYSDFEAMYLYQVKKTKRKSNELSLLVHADRRKWLRENIWNHLPLLIKPFLYFIYRYFIRLGFLDGKAGFIYYFLHSIWYYFVVDVKYIEIKMNAENITNQSINNEKPLLDSD